MPTITLFGLDIGKHSFHLIGQDANGPPLQTPVHSFQPHSIPRPAPRLSQCDGSLLWSTLAMVRPCATGYGATR